VTRLSCAEPRRSRAAGRSRAHRRLLRLAWATILLLLAASPTRAAQTRLRYDFGVSEIYSQDVLRIGVESLDDYITNLSATGAVDVTTPRSSTEFLYRPTYYAYSEFNELDHLDHRYRGVWNVRPGPRSTFALRQGFSQSTRQAGFADLDGAASEAGQPIIGLTRMTAWELEPEWDLAQTERISYSVLGLYRSEAYDRPDLIDTDQAGLEGSMKVAVGRAQTVGGRARGDRYRYSGPAATDVGVYDQFYSAQFTWGLSTSERFALGAGAGVFRGTGQEVDPTLGPTGDLSGTWRWRRSSLAISAGLGYASGGGLTSASRSERGDINYTVQWGRGFETSVNGAYIVRDPVQKDAGETLRGRSFALGLQKVWQPGWGVGAGVSGLRQQEQGGRDLNYGEATIGLVYRRPEPPERPTPPVQVPPPTPSQ